MTNYNLKGEDLNEHLNSQIESYRKQNRKTDLLEGTIGEKIPSWLRWIFVLPSSVLASILIPAIFFIISSSYSESDAWNTGWLRVVQSGFFGFFFVGAGAYIAPKYQIITSVTLLVVLAILITLLTTLGILFQSDSNWYLVMHALASLLGGGAAIISIKEALDS